MTPESMREVRQIIREELAKILMGTVVSNKDTMTLTVQRPSEAPLSGLRRIQPFGFASRAPAGTPTLVVPINADPTHLNSVGDFDPNRPAHNDGESVLYDAYGHVVYLSQTKMQFGSEASAENMVLGQVFKTFADNLLTAIANHVHIGNLGYDTSTPTNMATFTDLKSSPIDDQAILSDKCFTEK